MEKARTGTSFLFLVLWRQIVSAETDEETEYITNLTIYYDNETTQVCCLLCFCFRRCNDGMLRFQSALRELHRIECVDTVRSMYEDRLKDLRSENTRLGKNHDLNMLWQQL